jgi:Protein of unknown function (DUF3455)
MRANFVTAMRNARPYPLKPIRQQGGAMHPKQMGGALFAAALMWLSGPVHSQTQIPDTIAAPGEIEIAKFHAEGAQIYECKTDAGGTPVWQPREPVASLFADGKTMGRHYAGPTWELEDGSAVAGKVEARSPGASSNDVPWLKLKVTRGQGNGLLSGVTTVQRIDTKGGAASGPCDRAGALRSVPYSAEYRFLKRP